MEYSADTNKRREAAACVLGESPFKKRVGEHVPGHDCVPNVNGQSGGEKKTSRFWCGMGDGFGHAHCRAAGYGSLYSRQIQNGAHCRLVSSIFGCSHGGRVDAGRRRYPR